MANARKVVQTALLRVHNDDGYSNLVWNNALQNADFDARDTAFATTLFYGVIERCLTLDYVISHYSKTPIKKMYPPVLEALRMGVYQLLFMDSVPDRAAINESVSLIKNSKQNRLSGFVNGVLRSVQRDGNQIPAPAGSTAYQLSVAHSVPEDLVTHYITHYGEELTKHLLPAFLGGRPLFVRVNPLKTTADDLMNRLEAEGIDSVVSPLNDDILLVEPNKNPANTAAYADGLFHVQDPASGYACDALQIQPDMRVLDVCAAPGGKSFTLAQMMQNKGELVACDVYDHKISLIQEGADRLGLTCIRPTLRDANADDDIGLFDRILCDLPCSGLGILGRKPEIRYKSVTFLDNLPELQYGMLRNNLRHLKKGGILVFSTCTFNPKENEQNLARLLKEFPELEPCSILEDLPRVCSEQSHFINLFPHIHGTDGFFISSVRKAE